MILRKRYGVFLLLLMLIFALIGCSGVSKKEEISATPTSSPAPPQPVEEADTTEAEVSTDTDNPEVVATDGTVKKVAFISYMEDASFTKLRENAIKTLADKAYVDGKNIALTVYNLKGDDANCPVILDQIKALQPDLLMTDATGVCEKVIMPLANEGFPIILAADVDNNKYGFVQSAEKPGGNVTGMRTMPSYLQKNTYTLLNRLFPINGKKAVFITNGTIKMFNEQGVKDELSSLNIELKAFVEVANFDEYKEAVNTYVNDDEVGWILNGTWTPIDKDKNAVARADFVSWTNENNPKACVTWWEPNVAVGMLMGLAVDFSSLGNQVGAMAVKVLNGTKVGDIPVQDPEVINIILNTKRAEDMGLVIPADVLGSAKIYVDYEGHLLQ